VDSRNDFGRLSTMRDEEPAVLMQHLSETDSMRASIADPQRAPERQILSFSFTLVGITVLLRRKCIVVRSAYFHFA
jgi:hypothetical protein